MSDAPDSGRMSEADREANLRAMRKAGLTEGQAARCLAANDRTRLERRFDELVLAGRVERSGFEAALIDSAQVLRHVLDETAHPAPKVGHLFALVERVGRDSLVEVLAVLDELAVEPDWSLADAAATALDDVNEGIAEDCGADPQDHRERIVEAFGEDAWDRWAEAYTAEVRRLVAAEPAVDVASVSSDVPSR